MEQDDEQRFNDAEAHRRRIVRQRRVLSILGPPLFLVEALWTLSLLGVGGSGPPRDPHFVANGATGYTGIVVLMAACLALAVASLRGRLNLVATLAAFLGVIAASLALCWFY